MNLCSQADELSGTDNRLDAERARIVDFEIGLARKVGCVSARVGSFLRERLNAYRGGYACIIVGQQWPSGGCFEEIER